MKMEEPEHSDTSIGHILHLRTSHVRLLPVESRHSFSYPLVYVGVDLDDLESHRLDVSAGLIFGWFGWKLFAFEKQRALFSVHPWDYVRRRRQQNGVPDKATSSIKQRLIQEMVRVCDVEASSLRKERFYFITMPRLFGYAFNPVSFYYILDGDNGKLKWVVLEVNNTFDERHIYINRTGMNEESPAAKGFEHSWVFKRNFHVSPFNDRLGFYRLSTSTPLSDSQSSCQVKINVSLIPPEKTNYDQPSCVLKLVTTLTGSGTRLTGPALISTFLSWPLDLFLTFPRILFEAWKLQYRKRLDVLPKPDPSGSQSSSSRSSSNLGGGLRWQELTGFERLVRSKFLAYLQQRVDEESMTVTLKSGDPMVPDDILLPPILSSKAFRHLQFTYLSNRIFVDFYTSETSKEAFVLGSGTEGRWWVDNMEEYIQLFGLEQWKVNTELPTSSSFERRLILIKRSINRGLRRAYNRWHKSFAQAPLDISSSKHPLHPMDNQLSWSDIVNTFLFYLGEFLTYHLFILVRARFAPGTEPWAGWGRYRNKQVSSLSEDH